MSTDIYVSIIIPSLNTGQYIKKCLDSIIRQSLREIEIISVDAGSTDGTIEILQEYAKIDKRIKIIKSDKKSYGYQVNIGIREAKGEYIGIVEPDDFIELCMYKNIYEKVRNRKVDYVKCGFFEYSDVMGKQIILRRKIKNNDLQVETRIDLNENRDYGMLNLVRIWAGIYRREFLKENDIKLNETKGASYQDVSFTILVGLLAKDCIYSNDSYYYYRIDNENSSVKANNKYACVVEEFQYVKNELVRHNIDSEYNNYLVLQQKLKVYQSNYEKLSSEEKMKFLQCIHEELIIGRENQTLYKKLNKEQKKIVEVLLNSDKILECAKEKEAVIENIKQLIENVQKGNKYVIVGSGQYGDTLLLLQSIFSVIYIEAICDNSMKLQGEKKDQYVILSVEEAVNKYKKDRFIIANKNYADAIFEQLLDLGINQENIWIFNKMLPTAELIQLCKSIINE